MRGDRHGNFIKKVEKEQTELILKMQQKAFAGHYEKYQDYEISSATEMLERVISQILVSDKYQKRG